jgi:hypothetical protein
MTFSTDGNKLCIADIVVATGTVIINDGTATSTVVFAGVEPEVISVDFTLLKNGNCP